MTEQILFELLNGVVWGLLLALIALGLCLIYGLMGVINIAHGSLYMVGAICAAYMLNSIGLNFWLVLLLAGCVVGVLGFILNLTIFELVHGRDPAIGLLATAGVFLTVDNVVLAVYGGEPESVMPPLTDVIEIGSFFYPTYRIAAAGVALATLLGVAAFLRYTKYGLWMRAVPQARDLAAATGVPIRRVNALTAVLGGATAGLAGALSTPISGAYFQMGLAVLASSFIVVVIGGMGNLLGVVAVSIGYGVLRGFASTVLVPTWSEVATLSALLVVLYFKPNGIFGGRT